jgi:hypothetical protein
VLDPPDQALLIRLLNHKADRLICFGAQLSLLDLLMQAGTEGGYGNFTKCLYSEYHFPYNAHVFGSTIVDYTDQTEQEYMHESSTHDPIDLTDKTSAGEWMTLQAASVATGLSLITLRRYIKKRTIKGRRLGRTSNAKLEVFVTPSLQISDKDRISTEGLEEVLNGEVDEALEEFDDVDQVDHHADQATRETLEWMRERLDDKEEKIEVLQAKVEQMARELAGASYRNGYLESQNQQYQEQLKLITMRPVDIKVASWWAKFASWFVGKPV